MHVKAFESVEELSSLLTTSVRNATLEVFSTMAYT